MTLQVSAVSGILCSPAMVLSVRIWGDGLRNQGDISNPSHVRARKLHGAKDLVKPIRARPSVVTMTVM